MNGVYVIFSLLAIGFLSCSDNSYDPDKHLSSEQKDVVLTSIVRYVAKPPQGATDENKFDAKFKTYYDKKVSEIKLEQFYPKDSIFYFLISQTAPSMTVKKHATGGKFILNDKGEMSYYEEVFRTWKMVPDTLIRRGNFLFDKMVKGEDLKPFETKNSSGVEYIEFPDDNTEYDSRSRKWQFKN